jgi:hypothetical protein
LHAFALRNELIPYGKWWLGQKMARRDRQQVAGMDGRLADHVEFALQAFQRHPAELSAVMRKHQLKLADRQCRMAELSQRIQDTVVILVTALWAHQQENEVAVLSADMLCRDLRRKLTGERPSDRYFRDASKLADAILAGGFESLAGVPRAEILMRYENATEKQ